MGALDRHATTIDKIAATDARGSNITDLVMEICVEAEAPYPMDRCATIAPA